MVGKLVNELIITFVHKRNLDNLLYEVKNTFNPQTGIWLLKCETFGSMLSYTPTEKAAFIENSIFVHRKKESNTLYTINAMNELIRCINNGVLDKSYKISWENYQNTLLIQKSGILIKEKFKLEKIY